MTLETKRKTKEEDYVRGARQARKEEKTIEELCTSR